MYRRVKVKKQKKKSILKSMNVFIILVSILASIGITGVSGFFYEEFSPSVSRGGVFDSVDRIANAFDLYNNKRFVE